MKVVSVVGCPSTIHKVCPGLPRDQKGLSGNPCTYRSAFDSEMSDIFFKELEIPEPDYHLGVGSGMHGKQTGQIILKVEEVLLKETPDILLGVWGC